MKYLSHLIIVSLLFLGSCKLPNDSTIQADTPPEFQRISLYPSVIEVDDIGYATSAESIIDTSILVAVNVRDINLDISDLEATLIAYGGKILASNIKLRDDGLSPDSVSNDGIFFGKADISFKKKEIGNYTVSVNVSDLKNQNVTVLSYLQIINSFNKAPVISALLASDTITIPTGKDTSILRFRVFVQDKQGLNDIQSVNAVMTSTDGMYVLTAKLYDDGGSTSLPPYFYTSGDSIANDSIFSVQVPFLKQHVGSFLLQVSAQDSAQAFSNILAKTFVVKNQINNQPVLSNLLMPDTAFVPTGNDTTFVPMKISVSDIEGLPDIYSVYFTSLRPDSSFVGTYFLFDDGSAEREPQFNLFSGDSVANDGRYALTIPLTSGSAFNTYRDFIFQARDRAGAVSAILTRRIYLR